MVDCYGRTYEFVSKYEFKPIKKEIDGIIKQLQRNMREQYSITFKPVLVGSAKRSLVTRVVNGNTGFDFDYNFSIQKDSDYSAKQLKNLFINELNEILVNNGWDTYIENNRQAMTIKRVNRFQSYIIYSCDFAIVYDYEDEYDDFQKILIYDKETGNYVWNKRRYGKNYEYKLSNLLENGLWTEVKHEYLNLKNNNADPDKISFSVYLEAVNNVYNRYDWVN